MTGPVGEKVFGRGPAMGVADRAFWKGALAVDFVPDEQLVHDDGRTSRSCWRQRGPHVPLASPARHPETPSRAGAARPAPLPQRRCSAIVVVSFPLEPAPARCQCPSPTYSSRRTRRTRAYDPAVRALSMRGSGQCRNGGLILRRLRREGHLGRVGRSISRLDPAGVGARRSIAERE